MELHKRRHAIMEPETRYFMRQLIEACIYQHENYVIHRDLKLGNLFLNDDMDLKVGDFGLATKLDYEGERKKTLCGTPNYIAPEMLGKKGHSFEVDIWAIGCIVFTLLVGRPPFETNSLKETYNRIKKNESHCPMRISTSARQLIQRLLQPGPHNRPTIKELLSFEFFVSGFTPTRLPPSCLTMAPKLPVDITVSALGVERKPLTDTSNIRVLSPMQQVRKDMLAAPFRALNVVPENYVLPNEKVQQHFEMPVTDKDEMPFDCYLGKLYGQLIELIHADPVRNGMIRQEEAEDPASAPIILD
ncbi:unnamed protein product [Soboliphyme baturini]|uniref:Protein kinase domain-containing protein n=1 Tax=Soboliphyme baturini TaxID=241478 RepID=A0A183IWS5_9BILA|nr:unnamed protein product [Soboliphyme baturini]